VRSLALWNRLYLLIWLAFAQFVLAALAEIFSFIVDIHFLVGLAVLAVAHLNYRDLKKTAAPARVKRISKSTAIMATVQPLLGLPIYAGTRMGFALPFEWVIGILHLIVALTIISQASSTATAYDMWEEKELS